MVQRVSTGSSVQASSTLIGRRRHEDAGLFLHYVARGLLQRSSRWIAEVHNWHFTACAECSSSSCHKHWQVRPWPIEYTSWPVTLPQHRRSNRVQACCYGSPVSGEQRSSVLEWPLHSGQRRQQSTPMISQQALADCTALSANYIRPSGFLCCRPDSLELTTEWISWSFRRTLKTILFATRDISAFSGVQMYAWYCVIQIFDIYLSISGPECQLVNHYATQPQLVIIVLL